MNAEKMTAIALLANGVYHEVITEDQAIGVMKAMDSSAKGTDADRDAVAANMGVYLKNILVRYETERER